MDLFDFLDLSPKNVTLVRLLSGPAGSTTEVACGASAEDVRRLLQTAERQPYLDRNAGWVQYRGVYLRPSHDVDARGWLEPRPRLTEVTASRYVCFMVDVDALKAGDAATDHELEGARACAEEILTWLSETLHLSAVFGIMSGNGYQLVVRGRLDLDHQWLVAELLVRMRARWPMVDLAGYKPTVGPAVPGTMKRKGADTSLHRMVAVEWASEGNYWCTADDLVALVNALPAAPTGSRLLHRPVVMDEWQSVHTLPVSDVLYKVMGEECCPVCKSTDSAFAVISDNVCVCLHGRRCPAAASGHRGFTAAHVYGYRLFTKWTAYTAAERGEIIDAAQQDGFDLAIDDELARIRRGPPPEAIDAVARIRARHAPEPSRHRSIRPGKRWVLKGASVRECAELLRQEILSAYCPSWVKDHNDVGDSQPIVFDAGTFVYHEELGIFVPALRRSGDESEEGAVSRILRDVEQHGILYTDPAGKPKSFHPSTTALLTEFERYCKNVGYSSGGPVGIACRDGFLALEDGQLVERAHSPANRARGRLQMFVKDADPGNYHVRTALEEFALIVRKLLRNHSIEDCDRIALAILSQVGAAICRMRAEVRRGIILKGPPDTGKSVLIKIIRALFERLGLSTGAYDIGAINSDYPPLGLATDAANLVDELESFVVTKTSRLKQLVEGTPWAMNRKHRDQLTVRNSMLMIFGVNGDITFRESSGALVKRFMVIEFPNQPVSDEERDPQLARRFIDQHLDGLGVGAVITAITALVKGRTEIPTDKVREDSSAVLRESNPVEEWFRSCALLTPECATPRDELHENCIAWMRAHGFEQQARTLTPRSFTASMKRIGGVQMRVSHSLRFFNVLTTRAQEALPTPVNDRL